MIPRHARKYPRKKRADDFCDEANRPGLFTDIHDAQPQSHHARQRQGDVHHASTRRFEGAIDDAFKDFDITEK